MAGSSDILAAARREPVRAAAPPTVTVIIPTYNRAPSLAGTLASISRQEYPPERLDVLVVDNSSVDATEDVVRAAAAQSKFKIRYFRKENRGPAASRNFAIGRSSGEILAFTDSDCQMPPDWVARAVQHFHVGVGFVAGPVRPINHPERLPGFFAHQVDHRKEDFIYATANVFYRREIVRAVGGFNESFGAYPWGTPVGGEDTDLAWRVKRAGYQAAFVPDLPVYHEATTLPIKTWLVEPIRAQILPRLVRDLPELRAGLWRRYFLSRSSALYDVAAIGAVSAFAMRRPALLALALPWLWDQRSMIERDIRVPKRWWRIPLKYALNGERHTVQAVALLYASIRHRTPVL